MTAVPLAELLGSDMWMGDVAGFSSGIWLGGDHVIRTAITNPTPAQAELKRAQVDLFQHDRLGRDRDRLVYQVDGEALEFLRKRV